MKFRTIIMITALACFIQEAKAFYNPSTGRWLSRDPIEEHTFANRTYLSQLSLSEASYSFYENLLGDEFDGLYTFNYNEPVVHYDFLGLLTGNAATRTISDCNIEIYAGHGFLDGAFDGDGKLKNPQKLSNLKYPHILKGSKKCSGVTIIACNAAKYASVENPIPGTTLNDGEITRAQGYAQIDSAVRQSSSFADSICKDCSCDNVYIVVNCFPPFKKPGVFTSGSPWCGETIKVSCKKKAACLAYPPRT